MHSLQISRKAEDDIDGIVAYTLQNWGPRQAELYTARLEGYFALLAARPAAGRVCEQIRPHLRRFEVERHIVFYDERMGRF